MKTYYIVDVATRRARLVKIVIVIVHFISSVGMSAFLTFSCNSVSLPHSFYFLRVNLNTRLSHVNWLAIGYCQVGARLVDFNKHTKASAVLRHLLQGVVKLETVNSPTFEVLLDIEYFFYVTNPLVDFFFSVNVIVPVVVGTRIVQIVSASLFLLDHLLS